MLRILFLQKYLFENFLMLKNSLEENFFLKIFLKVLSGIFPWKNQWIYEDNGAQGFFLKDLCFWFSFQSQFKISRVKIIQNIWCFSTCSTEFGSCRIFIDKFIKFFLSSNDSRESLKIHAKNFSQKPSSFIHTRKKIPHLKMCSWELVWLNFEYEAIISKDLN